MTGGAPVQLLKLLPFPPFQPIMKALVLILVALTVSFAPATSRAQEETVEVKARKLLETHKGSLVVVTAKGLLKAKTSGDPLPDREQQRRTLGITIGDDGLVVVSNSAIDAGNGSGIIGSWPTYVHSPPRSQNVSLPFTKSFHYLP